MDQYALEAPIFVYRIFFSQCVSAVQPELPAALDAPSRNPRRRQRPSPAKRCTRSWRRQPRQGSSLVRLAAALPNAVAGPFCSVSVEQHSHSSSSKRRANSSNKCNTQEDERSCWMQVCDMLQDTIESCKETATDDIDNCDFNIKSASQGFRDVLVPVLIR